LQAGLSIRGLRWETFASQNADSLFSKIKPDLF